MAVAGESDVSTVRSRSDPSRRGRGVVAWWALTVVLALAAGVVLGRWAFAPPSVDQVAAEPATVEVVEMTVGTSVPVAVSASWQVLPFGVGAAAGTLTSLEVSDGDEVAAGERLYSVDLRPVVGAQGDVPAFRDLSQGATGRDVAQLQRLLIELGHLPEGGDDGRFGAGTATAVKEWQRALGVTRDGVVRAGDVVFTAQLPTRVQLMADVAVGDRLAAGDVVLAALRGTPEFVAVVQGASSVDTSLPILVTFGDEQVETVVAATRSDMNGNTILVLTRADGSPVCGQACDQVPLDPREAVYPSRQVVVPEVTGPGVPAAAVSFHADGSAFVVDSAGQQIPVEVIGQGQGRAVLDGVPVGTVVRLVDGGASSGESAAAGSGSGRS